MHVSLVKKSRGGYALSERDAHPQTSFRLTTQC